MEVDYKLFLNDVPRQVYIFQLETFSYDKKKLKFDNHLQEICDFQKNLNDALTGFTNFYENRDENGIDNISEIIVNNFPDEYLSEKSFRKGVIEIFNHFDFHQKIIDLLHYEQWQAKFYTMYILLIIINCEDEKILSYLIENNLIQIINSCIVSNNKDSSHIAILCLGNFIAVTGNQYQKLICDTIKFEDIEAYFYKENNKIIYCALFFLQNVICFFKYIPDQEKFVNLLIKLILPQRIQECIIASVTICFIEMIRIDRNVLDIMFSNENLFLQLYNIFIDKDNPMNFKTKMQILLFFVIVARALDSLCEDYPDSKDVFIDMKKMLFQFTFNSFKPLRIAIELNNDENEKEESECISMALELLSKSILVNEEFRAEFKDVYKIIRQSMGFKDGSFKLKSASLSLLLTFIYVFSEENNLDVLRIMREFGISEFLIDHLAYDGNMLFSILNSILRIIRAFQSTVESESVKNEFIENNLGKALDEIVDSDNDKELKDLIDLVRKEVFDEEEGN